MVIKHLLAKIDLILADFCLNEYLEYFYSINIFFKPFLPTRLLRQEKTSAQSLFLEVKMNNFK
jgi:hypothetical protein